LPSGALPEEGLVGRSRELRLTYFAGSVVWVAVRVAALIPMLVVALWPGLESIDARGASATPAVTVRTDELRYRQGQTIVVTIRNGLGAPLVATTGHTSCSIVSLDLRTTRGWNEVRNCYSGVPPVPVRIARGATARVRLRDRLRPGTYRARLEYRIRGRGGEALSRTMRVDR
jgi:hypothetical protein